LGGGALPARMTIGDKVQILHENESIYVPAAPGTDWKI
jgi:hypothetical protein